MRTTRDIPEVPESLIAEVLAAIYGIQGVLERLDSERELVLRCRSDAAAYVVRVSPETLDLAVLDMQVEALRHLERIDPGIPVPRVIPTVSGDRLTRFDGGGRTLAMRVTSYIDGVPLREAANASALRSEVGRLLGRLAVAMQGFFHPAAGHHHPWDLQRCHELLPLTHHIGDGATRERVESVFATFEKTTRLELLSQRQQVIHQDAHGDNVLVSDREISGLIDFGDMVFGPLASEIAVAADVATWPDPVTAIADVACGFDEIVPLQPEEIDSIVDLATARVATTITIGAVRTATAADESPAIANLESYGSVLEVLMNRPHTLETVRSAVRSPRRTSKVFDLAGRRQRVFGMHAPHFYEELLHVAAGRGQWVYDASGTQHLDFYNNVPQVGHAHPHVVNAINRQAQTLNTNSRYLYDVGVEYAERLTALLGDRLTKCLFVNSGSEANDVALQMARFVTGRQGIVVVDSAYHGVTAATRALGAVPETASATQQVGRLLPPDVYRGTHRGHDAIDRYVTDFDRVAGNMRDAGVAAFIVDSALCSNGILDPPARYFAGIARRVREAGGIVIADEVQSGLGRMGRWWGHEVRSFEPDIVTLGKPVGNGHPLGVVVATSEIMDSFMEATKLFSTFGGNPVSCAAGLAVLDVIEREHLIGRAESVGESLHDALRDLQDRHHLIGDVRGRGLVIGVELVSDRRDRVPATDAAWRVVESMRAKRVLIGTDGPDRNVLKLRPPLVIGTHEVQLFTDHLEEALREVERA